jgi:Thiamine monophosphate kinase
MLRLTGMTAEVAAADVPLSEAARTAVAREPGLVEKVLCGGDDYEILCAVAPDSAKDFAAAAAAVGVPVQVIGSAEPGAQPPKFKASDGRSLVLRRPSFQHF